MKIKLLLFGITADLLETSSTEIEVPENTLIKIFREILQERYSQLKNINSYAIAVNEEYAEANTQLKENDVVAIIPSVSGG